VAVVVVSLTAGWLQLQSLRQASDAAERVERTQLVRLAIERLRAAVRTAHADVGNYLLGGTESYLARFNDAQQDALRQLGRLDDFSHDDPALKAPLERLRPVVAAVFEVLTQAIRVPAERRADEAVRLAGPGACACWWMKRCARLVVSRSSLRAGSSASICKARPNTAARCIWSWAPT